MQHYTRNTVEATEWCRRCGRMTRHRVDAPKLGPCLKCMERVAEAPAAAVEPTAVQGQLFAAAEERKAGR